MAFTVPKGMVVCFAILLAPKLFSRFKVSTCRIAASGSGGLPSRWPFARAVFSPIIVRSDILAVSCLARVANIETMTSLNGQWDPAIAPDMRRTPPPLTQVVEGS
jgi:hypothetical protein